MQVIRCTKCMGKLEADMHVCPWCGYDQYGEIQPANGLKRNTILCGRYLVGNVIGQGGFGITYVGYDLTLEMKVAIKEYFPSGCAMRVGNYSNTIRWDFGEDDRKQWSEGIERFLKEARRMARLDSVPSVVRVRDAFRENQTAYIVMDFVEGDTLKRYLLGHGVLKYDECIRLLSPILDSLAVIHDNGFIHRDISPDNIMLQPDGTARLLDMGAAVDVKASEGHASMVVVKRNFSAPEQYTESEPLGSWTDVYSMAATMYYCLTGKVVPEAMEREFKKTPLAFASQPGIPQYAIETIEAGLELNPEKRIKNMREFKERLAGPAKEANLGAGHTVSGQTAAERPAVEPEGHTGKNKKKAKGGKKLPGPVRILGKVAGGIVLALFLLGVIGSLGDSDSPSEDPETTAAETAIAARIDTKADTKASTEAAAIAETEEESTEDKEYEMDATDDFGEYSLNDDGTYTLQFCYLGNTALIQIPEECAGKPVTAVASGAFSSDPSIEQVRFPDSVERLEEGVFTDCQNLRAVFIPSSVREIGGALIDDEELEHKVVYFTGASKEEAVVRIEEMDWAEDWKGDVDWTWYPGMDFLEDGNYKGWRKDFDDIWMYYEDGFTRFGWQTINGKWYYFNDKAAALTGWANKNDPDRTYYFDEDTCDQVIGWREIDGKWYYFDMEDGHLLRSTTTPDGYTVDENGVYSK